LRTLLALPEGPERTAALVSWFQSLFEGVAVPILVGGAAVELYTGGAYTTGDLDFVGHLTPAVERRLRAEGFSKEGRSWRLGDDVFLELPAGRLEPGARAVSLRVGDREVVVLALEELLLDRLAAWKHWRSEVDAGNALLLWMRYESEVDQNRLQELAAQQGLIDALDALRQFAAQGPPPSDEEIERWARTIPR
jgi:hypothetical protein